MKGNKIEACSKIYNGLNVCLFELHHRRIDSENLKENCLMQEEKYVSLIVEISWFRSEDAGDGAHVCDAIAMREGEDDDDPKKNR